MCSPSTVAHLRAAIGSFWEVWIPSRALQIGGSSPATAVAPIACGTDGCLHTRTDRLFFPPTQNGTSRYKMSVFRAAVSQRTKPTPPQDPGSNQHRRVTFAGFQFRSCLPASQRQTLPFLPSSTFILHGGYAYTIARPDPRPRLPLPPCRRPVNTLPFLTSPAAQCRGVPAPL